MLCRGLEFVGTVAELVQKGEEGVGAALQQRVVDVHGRAAREAVRLLPDGLQVGHGLVAEGDAGVSFGEPEEVDLLGALGEVFGLGQRVEDE